MVDHNRLIDRLEAAQRQAKTLLDHYDMKGSSATTMRRIMIAISDAADALRQTQIATDDNTLRLCRLIDPGAFAPDGTPTAHWGWVAHEAALRIIDAGYVYQGEDDASQAGEAHRQADS